MKDMLREYQQHLDRNLTVRQESVEAVSNLRDGFSPLLFTLRDQTLAYIDNFRKSGQPPVQKSVPNVSTPEIRPIPPELQFGGTTHFAKVSEIFYKPTHFYLSAGVGEYGLPLSSSIVRSAILLSDILAEQLEPACNDVADNYPLDVQFETFRKNPALTIMEGIQTTAYVLGLVTADKVTNNQSAAELLDLIQGSNLLTQLSLKAPFGFFGPAQQQKLRFSRPVQLIDGKLAISRDLQDRLDEIKASRLLRVAPGERVLGCPVGHRIPGRNESGIHAIGEAFVASTKFFLDNYSL